MHAALPPSVPSTAASRARGCVASRGGALASDRRRDRFRGRGGRADRAGSDPVADADRTVDAAARAKPTPLRRQYFAELVGRLARSARLRSSRRGSRSWRAPRPTEGPALAHERAVDAYKRSGSDLAALVDGSDSLDAARRSQLARAGSTTRDDVTVAVARRDAPHDLSRPAGDLRTKHAATNATRLAQVQGARATPSTPRSPRPSDRRTELPGRRRRHRRGRRRDVHHDHRAGPPVDADDQARDNHRAPPAPEPRPRPPRRPTRRPRASTRTTTTRSSACTRGRESGGNYAAFNPAGPYLGAYQFLQATWNAAANHAGRTDLIGVPPNAASPYDQDDVAWSLYQWPGQGPVGRRLLTLDLTPAYRRGPHASPAHRRVIRRQSACSGAGVVASPGREHRRMSSSSDVPRHASIMPMPSGSQPTRIGDGVVEDRGDDRVRGVGRRRDRTVDRLRSALVHSGRPSARSRATRSPRADGRSSPACRCRSGRA